MQKYVAPDDTQEMYVKAPGFVLLGHSVAEQSDSSFRRRLPTVWNPFGGNISFRLAPGDPAYLPLQGTTILFRNFTLAMPGVKWSSLLAPLQSQLQPYFTLVSGTRYCFVDRCDNTPCRFHIH